MTVQFTFPDATDLANDTLATKPHSTLHGDLGDTLEAYIAALGKVTSSGFQSQPTLYDPAATNWYDSGWTKEVFDNGNSEHEIHFGHGPILGNPIPAGAAFLTFKAHSDEDLGGYHEARLQLIADPNVGNPVDFVIDSSVDTDGGRAYGIWTYKIGTSKFQVEMDVDVPKTTLTMVGMAGQTLAIFDLESGMFAIVPDGSVGGVAPSAGDSIKWDGSKWIAQA